jgi:hypothetical protein
VASSSLLQAYLTPLTSADAGIYNSLMNTSTVQAGPAATHAALTTGALTGTQQKIIAAVGTPGAGTTVLPWNKDGTEPTSVATIRGYGWIKLNRKSFTNGKLTGGVYQLTTIGRQIYNRTSAGGAVNQSTASASTSSSTSSASSAAADAAAIAKVKALLAGLNLNV